MKRFYFIFLGLLVFTTMICGCQRHRIRQSLKTILRSSISLPDSLSCIIFGNLSYVSHLHDKTDKLIIFIDSTECSKCRIESIVRYDSLFRQSTETNKYKVIFLLSLNKESHDEIIDFLSLLDLPYPVYIDEKNEFMQINPAIPDDPRFQTLFISGDGRALLVGDPVLNPAIMPLFNKLLDGSKHENS